MRLSLPLTLLATPALADSEEAWVMFRQDVTAACLALVAGPGEISMEVSPFGSESYGAALVTLTTGNGTDRMICVVSKETCLAELTTPFTPAE